MPELISDCETQKQKQKQRIKTKTKRRKALLLLLWSSESPTNIWNRNRNGVANGKWHSLFLFAHLQPFREAHPMSGGRDRDRQTNTHSVDILGRAFNVCVCSLCDPRHKKKRKQTTNEQTNSHWPNSINFWPLSALHAHIWHRTGAASYVHEQGMQRSKRSLFRQYIYITL